MEAWQEKYIENTRRIMLLTDFSHGHDEGFEKWIEERRRAEEETVKKREENIALISGHLFPLLDSLYSQSEETLENLSAFADQLMDWKVNLDCGLYVAIHEALLTRCRVRGDQRGVIMELYKLGMGYYYLGRMLIGLEHPYVNSFKFQNEMLFTEAASYLKYFERFDDDTRGYIVRALANRAICTPNHKRKIAATRRAMDVSGDPQMRALAPGLPWDKYMRACHQQMSANRHTLRKGDLTPDELAAVLDSCWEVFKPEESAENPSLRWLWPYYEMEYTCGYVDLETTLNRLERLIRSVPYDQYDYSGLYGNIQLALFYGRLMKEHANLRRDPARVHFLDNAYRKMLKSLLTLPPEKFDDYLTYLIADVISDYYEIEGTPTYRDVVLPLMQRFTGPLYVNSRQTGRLMAELATALYDADPAFFDDAPCFRALPKGDGKREAIRAFAEEAGLFHALGQIKMNVRRLLGTRQLLESEDQIYRLYTVSGHNDLDERASTRDFADIALGHRKWYNDAGGFPDDYTRAKSPFRQMTDVAAVCSFLAEHGAAGFDEALKAIFAGEGTRFSPLVTRALADEGLTGRLESILSEEGEPYYREAWESFRQADRTL